MNFQKLLNNKKITTVIIAIGIIGILLIFLSDIKIPATKSEEVAEDTDAVYIEKLEEDIKKMIKSITGDRNISVVITLKEGTEYIYATEKNVNADVKENQGEKTYNNETSDNLEEKYIIINKSDGQEPLLTATHLPKIRGVSVVCDSGSDEEICETLKNSLKVLLDINESKISISGRY